VRVCVCEHVRVRICKVVYAIVGVSKCAYVHVFDVR
jgi:hypothetical protein